MSLFGNRLKYLNGQVWDTTHPGFRFPELDDSKTANRQNIGIAISGGGTRSASCATGQLRALMDMGLLSKFRYLSTVSGGAWAGIPFSYLPSEWNDETFLGMVIPPEELTLDHLTNIDRNSFLHAIINSVFVDDYIEHATRFAGDETFSRAIGDVFLERFGLDSLKRLFSFTPDTINAAVRRNPNARESDFYGLRQDRPYLIVGGTVLRPQNESPLPSRLQIEMTPYYTGIYPLHEGAGSHGQNIGGGYIESFAFDSDAPERGPMGGGVETIRLRLGARRHRFTLSDVAGATGAAPAEVFARIGIDWIGLPEFKYWPVNKARGRRFVAREYEFGDGGILENLGIMPLLLRKVERMIVFVNTKHALHSADSIADSIPPLFGERYPVNQVFPSEKLKDLISGFSKQKAAGKTVMHQDTYDVQQNDLYGIMGGWRTKVLWIYNERVPAWENELKPEIRSLIGQGSLGNFPHYKTFFQNKPRIIDLSAKQASMLAHLSCWNLTANRKAIEEFLM